MSISSAASSTQLQVQGLLADHVENAYSDAEIEQLRAHFAEFGYVKLKNLVPAGVYEMVDDEVHCLLDDHARRIDIQVKETGNTPRLMSTVSQKAIAQSATIVPAVYESTELKALLSRIAGETVNDCPWAGEKYVAIRQDKPGDTHGWHWGDFSFTVIWILAAPPAEIGGTLQTVANTYWDKSNPRTEEWLASGDIHSWDHETGDLYFLRSSTTLHRTVPLSQPAERIILNTCWASDEETLKEELSVSTHETMEAMFD